ncbi:MAG TPA: ketoacyl-ACP synthase III [Candidatus Nanoarchaeia archaeon]|nr:ketoacyl-ACP synthase III [Candidatus Nanoarchaeia archaeon]
MLEYHMRIKGTGRRLPTIPIPNSDFVTRNLYSYKPDGTRALLEGRTEEKILETTGIAMRYKAFGHGSLAAMAYGAAEQALSRAGVAARELDGIIVATLGANENIPSIACQVQKHLGVSTKNAFDINNACAGFPTALKTAYLHAAFDGGMQRYLIIGAERLTAYVDEDDINSILFGDGAGAAVVETADVNDEGRILAFYSSTDSSNGNCDLIYRDAQGKLRMPYGNRVFRPAVNAISTAASIVREELNWTDKPIAVIPHQANRRITSEVKSRLKPGDKVYDNIARYGNMSAATCIIALDGALETGFVEKGDRVILSTFGAGTVTSAVAIQY